jgi:signal transduction histidine kinase
MRANSLSFRLTFFSALVSLILLASAAIFLAQVFTTALERNFDGRLRGVLDGLLANVELGADGALAMDVPVSDPRFGVALSGWYWQVLPPVGKELPDLASESLLEVRLAATPEMLAQRNGEGIASFYMVDAENKRLRVIEQKFKLFGGEDEYSFLVAGNFDELKEEIRTFHRTLYVVLGLLGVGLLAAVFLQVNLGLRPLKRMQESLSAIRSGRAEKLEGSFPSEIQPVAEELNLLIQANTEIIDRARTQVGNLAHALKTPLSVLTNEAQATKGPLANKVEEQARVMRDHVNLYLDRARRAARAQTIGSVCEVEDVLQGIGRTLARINRDRGISFDVKVAPGLKFRGERQDLEEMMGNLMDNAGKWATQAVTATAAPEPVGEDGRHWLTIDVDDDGPGIPAEKRVEAMKRGRRLDETKSGSGLGLSIVTETAAMYGGRIELGDSPTGGLRVKLRLPTVS